MKNNYIENMDKITKNFINHKSLEKTDRNYKMKPILDTSLYKKYEAIKTERWSILLK